MISDGINLRIGYVDEDYCFFHHYTLLPNKTILIDELCYEFLIDDLVIKLTLVIIPHINLVLPKHSLYPRNDSTYVRCGSLF